MTTMDTHTKSKLLFHMEAAMQRPQDEFHITVDNANVPFQHLFLKRSDDGQSFIHLENHSAMDFVDKDVSDAVPVKPPSIETTPFKLVEEVNDLKDLAAKLHSVHEFAVDLEYNKYRSFQGLTCLMQISTRTEDFIVDTLKLHNHIGHYLRDVFKDPTKRKVMHGADQDIGCLQRDFGIYICNLFDTHQASRVLKLERNSLAHLLHHFCQVTANKEYQTADWRQRPLPYQMLRYAREDTHYLLHLYDLMRIQLFSLSTTSQSSDSPLVEVYKNSYDVSKRLYEKQLLTENSYLNIYGLKGANLNAQQLAIVSGLYKWRDTVARAVDESTGYVLPNKSLLQIAKQMPITTTTSMLKKLAIFQYPYVERDLDTIVNIIRHSTMNAPAFQKAAQELKGQGVEEDDQVQTIQTNADTERNMANNCYMNGCPMMPRFPPMPGFYCAQGFRLRFAPRPPAAIPWFWPARRPHPTMIAVQNKYMQPHFVTHNPMLV